MMFGIKFRGVRIRRGCQMVSAIKIEVALTYSPVDSSDQSAYRVFSMELEVADIPVLSRNMSMDVEIMRFCIKSDSPRKIVFYKAAANPLSK
jgi:hypothetical protein